MSVLHVSLRSIFYGDNYDFAHSLLANEFFGGVIQFPFHSQKCSSAVEYIVAVVSIQDRIALCRILKVTRGKVNPDCTSIVQFTRQKIAMFSDIAYTGVLTLFI